MKRFHSLCAFTVAVLAFAVPAGAGDKKKEGGPPPIKRGPEYKVLESLVGAFDAQVKMYVDPTDPKAPPKESKGVMTRKMVLGGNFLQESFKGEFLGSTFTGMGLIGYDGNQKKYINTWFDSMSTVPMVMHGTYDADKKTFTMVGEDFEPNSKKKMKARDVLKIVSAETQTFEMFRLPDGAPAEFKVMDITYTKRKDEKKKEGK